MSYIIERDVSWLYFNHRVLQEAMDEKVPLYERIKFLAIYSSNLDEFVRVRVASLRRFKTLKKATRKELLEEVKPKKTLTIVDELMAEQLSLFGTIFEEQILPALEKEGIFIVKAASYNEEQARFVTQYFDEKVEQYIHPIFLTEEANPFLENNALYFVVDFGRDSPPAVVEIPSEALGRFVVLKKSEDILSVTYLDDIVRHNLFNIFPDKKAQGCYSIKVSRDADLYLEDEYEGDLVEQIKRKLDQRHAGLMTRFLYDANMPTDLLQSVRKKLRIKKGDLVRGARYHNFSDFFAFPTPPNRPNLHNPLMPPLPHPVLSKTSSIIQLMQKQDVVLHFPYQSFSYVPQLIREAAEDKQVESIKITLYRVASDSDVAKALLYALENSKQVTVFIEAKARFDEASNLYWGSKLEEAGANVIYSFPAIKVHTKLLLIGREEDEKLHYYTYIATGNFNEKTAKIYCDHALLTADIDIGKDIRQVFYLLERKLLLPKADKIMISPFNTRKRFERLVRREINNKRAGKKAYMILKMNSLEDPDIMEKLVEASQAGVKIKMIVRGICRLVPGIEGYTENIEIVSIIDRFLEHARVYIFCNDDHEKMYIASADWMTRNLDRRVEVAIPIEDQQVYQEIRDIINIQYADNVKARYITADQNNIYKENDKEKVRAQVTTYEYLKGKL